VLIGRNIIFFFKNGKEKILFGPSNAEELKSQHYPELCKLHGKALLGKPLGLRYITTVAGLKPCPTKD